MAAVITIALDGPVVGKGRPRFGRLPNGGVTTHTPEKTARYESDLKLAAQIAMAGRPLVEQPCSVEVQIDVEATASWPAWKLKGVSDGSVAATGKPDIDNVAKLVMDAFNKVVWRDDSLVTDLRISKAFADKPALRVYVRPLDTMPAQAKRRAA
jgi:Holliday junction resolvase RusA-like endonuclease